MSRLVGLLLASACLVVSLDAHALGDCRNIGLFSAAAARSDLVAHVVVLGWSMDAQNQRGYLALRVKTGFRNVRADEELLMAPISTGEIPDMPLGSEWVLALSDWREAPRGSDGQSRRKVAPTLSWYTWMFPVRDGQVIDTQLWGGRGFGSLPLARFAACVPTRSEW